MSKQWDPNRFDQKRAVVADDDREMRRLIVALLERAGFHVTEAKNGRELLKHFHRRRPGLVVTDVEMPKMNGLEALERIHRDSPAARVIVVTAFGDENVRQRAHRLGAAAVFSKPVDLATLRDTAVMLAGA